MVDKMNELDTEAVEPLVYINSNTNVWRADKIARQVERKDALRNAPG